MRPTFTLKDKPDIALGYSEPCCQGHLTHSAHRSYLFYLIRSKLNTTCSFSNWRIESAFSYAISHIIQVGSGKQMIWIYTRWVIAMMANLCMFRNGTKCDHPRHSMRHDPFPQWRLGSFFRCSWYKSSISALGAISKPDPAFSHIILKYISPKFINNVRHLYSVAIRHTRHK